LSREERIAGVLLHITSLPGSFENGELGKDAFQFVDFLESCGIKMWQVLPLGPTMSDLSPYQSTSAHAGNPKLISIDDLNHAHWFDKNQYSLFVDGLDLSLESDEISTSDIVQLSLSDEKYRWLRFAYSQFSANASDVERSSLTQFVETQKDWLEDYALYAALKENYENTSWIEWPKELRDRNLAALKDARELHSAEIGYVNFVQFIFYQQWMSLKKYANSKNVKIFGDLPLFVSHDSADVWANKELFKLDGEGNLLFVAGVPPDYFSETGQRWGNPVYDWVSHEVDSFNWWIKRLENQFNLFDHVRIDHFRGLESYWEIPASHETALKGYWVQAPGKKMLEAVERHFGKKLPLIAEDLGVITDAVVALKDEFSLPGMKILQFAFGGGSDNPYLPHNHEVDSVVYTGTHDNNTTLGWFNELSDDVKAHIYHYYGESRESMPWLLIRSAYASVANMVVLPMQDLMGLDETGRMNVPGTVDGNWLWRFEWNDLNQPQVVEYLNGLNGLYER